MDTHSRSQTGSSLHKLNNNDQKGATQTTNIGGQTLQQYLAQAKLQQAPIQQKPMAALNNLSYNKSALLLPIHQRISPKQPPITMKKYRKIETPGGKLNTIHSAQQHINVKLLERNSSAHHLKRFKKNANINYENPDLSQFLRTARTARGITPAVASSFKRPEILSKI